MSKRIRRTFTKEQKADAVKLPPTYNPLYLGWSEFPADTSTWRREILNPKLEIRKIQKENTAGTKFISDFGFSASDFPLSKAKGNLPRAGIEPARGISLAGF